MNKAVFLDRDGVINSNENHYYIYKAEDFTINTGVIEFLMGAARKGYMFIVISNQSGIAKGVYSRNDVNAVHQHFQDKLKQYNLEIEDFYFCDHHPDKTRCLCRKPGSLLIEKAIARFNIDVSNSFLIGDSERDIEAAEKAGVRGLKVESNTSILSLLAKI
jgi:D-glycero-D-manno-heptose 1,7-bisphosphate phosphatase